MALVSHQNVSENSDIKKRETAHETGYVKNRHFNIYIHTYTQYYFVLAVLPIQPPATPVAVVQAPIITLFSFFHLLLQNPSKPYSFSFLLNHSSVCFQSPCYIELVTPISLRQNLTIYCLKM